MEIKFLAPVLLVLLFFAVLSLFKRARVPEDAEYDSRKFLLTPAEFEFYKVLDDSVPENHIIVTKVRISDLLSVRKGLDRSRRQTAQNKINAKHIDFVLCNATDMSIVAAIELDDASHNRPDRIKRDIFVDSAFDSAEIPLIRFKVKKQYNVEDVIKKLQESLLTDGSNAIQKPILRSDSENPVGAMEEPIIELKGDREITELEIPDCPKCREPMRLRTGKRGKFKGKQFWGCSNYPKCKFVLDS